MSINIVKNVEYKIKDLENKIARIKNTIPKYEKRIENLKIIKDGAGKLLERYPNIIYRYGSAHLENVDLSANDWDKVGGMSLTRNWDHNNTSLKISFSFNKKYSEGIKTYITPKNGVIAKITAKTGNIVIYDYKSMISDDCPRKKSFIKKIKRYIIKEISKKNLIISDTSFDKDEFLKLLLLK
jgi:hypothetical protein